jgi:hypothetical protein
MSPKPSPDRDITEIFNRHRVTNIPSDQKELLGRPDSWAVELENTPHGLSQLPGHVLETVKATYVANKDTIQERTPISKKRSGSPITSASNKRSRNGNASTPGSGHAKPPQSSPERAVSWSRSPERIPLKDPDCITVAVAVDHNTQSSIVHETPKTGFGRPQRPTSKPIIENPPSSEETEDDLETRIPDAQPLHNGSINRTAVRSKPTAPSPLSTKRTMATPPCAQPSNTAQTVVPNTVFTNKENFRGNESPKTRRYIFKPIDMDDVGRKRRKSYNEKDRLPPTIMPPKVDSSMPASSDSIIPFTGNVPTTQESIRDIRESIEVKEEDEMMDHVEEIVPSTNLQGSTVDRPVVHGTDEKKPSNESKPTKQPTTSSQMSSSKANASTNSQPQINDQMATEKPPAPAPLIAPGAPLEPYEAFVQQYPDYPGDNGGDKLPGNKSNFIYACVYLNYLRPRKQLRDCLYDEFIRAYPCSYGEYVKRSRLEPMVAIKWFNQQKGPLIYNKYLVNRGNLSHILRSYPEEFAKANELVSKKNGDDAGEDDIMIYTSSEDEGEFDEDDSRRSVSRSSQHSSDRRSVESPQPIATIENDMEIDLPEIPSAPPSTSSRRRPSLASTDDLEIVSKPTPTTKPTTPAQPYIRRRNTASERRPLQSSRVQEILTQPPPPTSPQMPQTSMLPPSTIGGSAIKSTAPRPSQYFKKISVDNLLKATPKKRSAKDLEKLREHFRRSKGTGAQDRRSSSGRFE